MGRYLGKEYCIGVLGQQGESSTELRKLLTAWQGITAP